MVVRWRFLHILLHVICAQIFTYFVAYNLCSDFYIYNLCSVAITSECAFTILHNLRFYQERSFNSDSLLYKHVAKACMAQKKTCQEKRTGHQQSPFFLHVWCNHGATRIVLTLLRVAIDDIMIIIKINVNAILNFHKDKNVKYNRI